MKENGKERKYSTETVLNTISRGTVLEGKITTDGDIRVEGVVKGSIHCKAKLSVGEQGIVEGNIDVRNAFIAGNVKGTVIVRELLQLQESGRINGDIYTQKLSVQIGALFSGTCRMGTEAKTVMDRKNEELNNNGENNGSTKEQNSQRENVQINNPALTNQNQANNPANVPKIPS